MIRFRRMELKDLDILYRDQSLRDLLLVEPSGEKFGVILESGAHILGGLTGYALHGWARIQCVRPHPLAWDPELLDALIRSAIHILELSGCTHLFSDESGKPYDAIGFQPVETLGTPIPEAFAQTLSDSVPCYWLNLPEFFRQDPHGLNMRKTD